MAKYTMEDIMYGDKYGIESAVFVEVCRLVEQKTDAKLRHSRKNRHKKALKNGMNRNNSYDFSQSVAFIPRFT